MARRKAILGGVNIHGTRPAAKRARSGKTVARSLIAAALACGLSRPQATALLHDTVEVGVAIALAPSRSAELRRDLERRTAALVIGLKATPRPARAAA